MPTAPASLRHPGGSGWADATLSGHVEVDGAYFGGHVRPENRKEDRRGRRRLRGQAGTRQPVVLMRERGKGAHGALGRTLPLVFRREDEATPTIRERVVSGITVYADEPASWDAPRARFDMRRINHTTALSGEGACTDRAESCFARPRRAERGQHHHISGKYLGTCTCETAWREDTRRRPNGTPHKLMAAAALGRRVSRVWAGHWQQAAPWATASMFGLCKVTLSCCHRPSIPDPPSHGPTPR